MSKEELLIALLKSGQSHSKPYNKLENKECPDHFDPDYEGVWNVKDLFDEVNEDYYEPVITRTDFKGNYIQYRGRGDKYKKLSPEEYLDIIRPYLRDIINNHKALLGGFLEVIFMENEKFSEQFKLILLLL